jgi:sulfiredoxin
MLRAKPLAIGKIYVPTKRRTTLDAAKVAKIAESMLESGQTTPILVREDGERFVLVEGLHRLEACKSLGDEMILAFLVQARRH